MLNLQNTQLVGMQCTTRNLGSWILKVNTRVLFLACRIRGMLFLVNQIQAFKENRYTGQSVDSVDLSCYITFANIQITKKQQQQIKQMNIVSQRIRKTLDTQQKRTKYKLSVLKPKSILFENQSMQIGLKSSLIYDFYSSKYYLQLSVFFGNKTNKAVKQFNIEYKGNPALEMWVEDRAKIMKEHSQYKQRIFLGLFEPHIDPWMSLNYRDSQIELKSLVIPLNIVKYLNFITCEVENIERYHETFKYTEETKPFRSNKSVLKGGPQDLLKYFSKLQKHMQSIYYGVFHLGTQLDQYYIVFHTKREEMKIELSSGQNLYIPSILSNLSFLLCED